MAETAQARKDRLRSLLDQLQSAPPTLERQRLIREVRNRLLEVDGVGAEPTAFQPRPDSREGVARSQS